MCMVLLEVEGVNLILKILHAIIEDEDRDSPVFLKSQKLIESCNEILENYIGIDNDFSCPLIKELYYEYILEILDKIIDPSTFSNWRNKQIKSVQLCEELDDTILIHVGDINGR